jgi:hypothetical protein
MFCGIRASIIADALQKRSILARKSTHEMNIALRREWITPVELARLALLSQSPTLAGREELLVEGGHAPDPQSLGGTFRRDTVHCKSYRRSLDLTDSIAVHEPHIHQLSIT